MKYRRDSDVGKRDVIFASFFSKQDDAKSPAELYLELEIDMSTCINSAYTD